jgi:hypothetical protein
MLNYERCVQAIVHALIMRELGEEDIEGRTAIVSGFVLTTQKEMPDYAGWAIRLLTLLLDLRTYPGTWRPFHASALPVQLKQLEAWQASRLGFLRSTISFYSALTTFGVYSEIYGEKRAKESR